MGWIRSDVVLFYIVVVFLSWKFIWNVIYQLCGVYVSRISFSNGFVLSGVIVTNNTLDIYLHKLRIKLWGTSKIILEDIDIKIRPPTNNNRTKTSRNTETNINNKFKLNVFNNTIPRFLIRFFLRHIPRTNIELRNTIVAYSKFTYKIDTFTYLLNSRYSKRISDAVKIYVDVRTLNVAQSTKNSIENDTLNIFSLSNTNIRLNFLIDLKSGELQDSRFQLFISGVRLSVFNTIKLLLETYEKEPYNEVKSDNKVLNFNEKLQRMGRITKYIRELSIHLEDTDLNDIPIATFYDNVNFNTYMKRDKLKTCLNLNFKAATVNFQKLLPSSAGFSIMFDTEKDIPFHINSSIQLLNLHYVDLRFEDNDKYFKETDEILNIPNCSFTFKSNLLYRLLSGSGFKDIKIEFYSSANSPILDFDTIQLSEFLYNLILLKNYFQLKNLKKREISFNSKESEYGDSFEIEYMTDDKVDSNASMSMKSIWNLLNEHYPHLDMKLVIEQPRIIIKHKSQKKIEILNSSYSLLNFQISTSISRTYNIICHILHPSILYESVINNKFNSRIKEEIFGIEVITLDVRVLKNLKLDSSLEIKTPLLVVSNLENLRGVYSILSGITNSAITLLNKGSMYQFLNSEIINKTSTTNIKEIDDKNIQENGLFKSLPQWLLETKVKVTTLSLFLGSTSILLPKEFIHDENLLNFNNINSSTKISIESIIITLTNSDYDSSMDYPSDSSQETLASFNQECFWNLELLLAKLNISVKTNRESNFQSILSVPSIKNSISSKRVDSNNCLNTSLHIDQIFGNLDRYKIFTIVGSIYLMKEYIVHPVILIRKKIDNDFKKLSKASKPKINSFLDFFHLNLVLDNFQYVFHLSDDFKVKLQIFHSIFVLSNKKIKLSSNFTRLLTDSPIIEGKWDRVLCIDALKLISNDPKCSEKFNLGFDNIRFIHAHQLVVYKLFDNLSITIKIIKHLVECLNKDSKSKTNIVLPKETKGLNIPDIKLTAKKLSFRMEDDPFECELNMIFQLGLVEQNKRIELYSLWESKATNSQFNQNNVIALQKMITRSWIRKVKSYKHKLTQEIQRNKNYLFGNEIFVEKKNNRRILPCIIQPPLLSVTMSDIDLYISSTKFDISELPKFINKLGQGVPYDTKYSMLIPMFINLGISELRMHLRDYPLPLLYVSRNFDTSNKSILLSGHFIISEAFTIDKHNLRELATPLIQTMYQKLERKYYLLEIQKSLATVKMFFDLSVKFNSSNANRFVWGQSYQFGLQQVLLNLDQFSKPPVDPSMKLGIWDKIRLIMHGKFSIHSDTKLEIAFKGSRNPYSLFDSASGFILSFDEDVLWEINNHDDSRNFFEAKSESVSWYIPNYMAAPMLTWTRPSDSFVYLPKSTNFISSCFAYYLDYSAISSNTKLHVQFIEKNVIKLHGGVNFKVGFVLQRKISDYDNDITTDCKPHYLINLFDPKYTEPNHDSFKGFRSDFIHMAITLIASNVSCYNAIYLSPNTFLHFFNWWKLFNGSMQLPIRNGNLYGDKKNSMKFSQHLISNTFQFKIRSLFISHIYRDEDEANNKIECIGIRAKMDDFIVDLHQKKEPRIEIHEELSTNKKIKKMNFGLGEVHLSGIDLRSIDVSFDKENYMSMIDSQKKPDYKIHDSDKQWFDIADYEEAFMPSLNKSSRDVLITPLLYSKQFSYLREFLIDPIHLNMTSVIKLFEEVQTHECTLQSKNVFAPLIELYEDRINKLREHIDSNKKKGTDTSQLEERILSLEKNISETQEKWEKMKRTSAPSKVDFDDHFHNRFIFTGMLLKWNAKNRNTILKYIHYFQLKRSLRQYFSHESIATIEELIESAERINVDDISVLTEVSLKEKITGIEKSDHISSKDRLLNFDQILRKVKVNETIREDYMIEIVSPQIQLQSELTPNSVVLISAPTIDAKIMSVIEKNKNDHLFVNPKELEVRFGVILKDASIFILKKEDIMNSDRILLSNSTYGSNENWPPWLGVEICKNGALAGDKQLLVEKTSIMLTLDEIKPLANKLANFSESEDADDGSNENNIKKQISTLRQKLQVDIPKLIIQSTSEQYFALYVIILDLLFYTEPMSKSLVDKLEKLRLSIDLQDFGSLHQRVGYLHNYHYLLKKLLNNYHFRRNFLNNEEYNDYAMLLSESRSTDTDIYLLMQSILTGDFYKENIHSSPKILWNICADEIILHMLEDDRKPILDIAIAQGNFKRIISEDGSNENRIEIKMMQGFNLIPCAYYRSLIEPYEEKDAIKADDNLIVVDWTMNRSIGGIKIMENFEIQSKPLNIKIDEITGEKLMKFIFRADSLDDVNNNNNPVIKIINTRKSESSESMESEPSSDKESSKSKSTSPVDQQLSISNLHSDKDDSDDNISKSNEILNSKKSQSFYSDFSGLEYQENIKLMLKRSNTYMSIISLKIGKISLMISIKLSKGIKRLMNVQDFLIHLPELNIENKFLSFLDIAMMFKKMVIKSLLNHSGRLLENKFTIKKKRYPKSKLIKPLKRYEKFINITDLEVASN